MPPLATYIHIGNVSVCTSILALWGFQVASPLTLQTLGQIIVNIINKQKQSFITATQFIIISILISTLIACGNESTDQTVVQSDETALSDETAHNEAKEQNLSEALPETQEQTNDAQEQAQIISQPQENNATQLVEDVTTEANELEKSEPEAISVSKPTEKELNKAKPSNLDSSKYRTLETPISVSSGEKIQVTELFWYGCGHCFALESFVKNWLKNKPQNAEFVKIPAIFSQRWEFHGKAYYTMQALGVLEQANDAFFKKIHVERKQINQIDQLTSFLSNYGKSEDEVTAAFNSFAVDTQLRNAKKISAQSTADGVPAILVDGKYYTSVKLAGGAAKLFDVIDQLVDKAWAER